jgi:hypothetical protein
MSFRRMMILASVALLVGATLMSTPATAKKSEKCPRFKPVPPETSSARAQEVPDLPVLRVTDRASAKKPLIVEFDQEASVWWYAHSQGRGPIVDGNRYFNIQVDTKKEVTGLHVRLEWPIAPLELDLYMYYEYGSLAAWSESTNAAPAGTDGTGGPGFEYIQGFPVARCTGFVIEDNAMWTTPQSAQLKLWLGPIEWEG